MVFYKLACTKQAGPWGILLSVISQEYRDVKACVRFKSELS